MPTNSPTDAPDYLTLPELEIPVRKRRKGKIRHIVAGARDEQVAEVQEIRLSPRRKAPLYTLESGETVAVSRWKGIERPANVDGLVYENENGDWRWLSHRWVDQIEQQAKQSGLTAIRSEIADTWRNRLQYRQETIDGDGNIAPGLRAPQVGTLHAIGAHWSLHTQLATVVMPTGTGKTEAMLAVLVAYDCGPLLVIVPSQSLREQTARKFLGLGLLRQLKVIPPDVRNPVVGIVTGRAVGEEDLAIFDECNVVVGTMSALGLGSAAQFTPAVAGKVGALIVDEAHHVAASSWSAFREHFERRRVLQFTATPYRRDGKLIDGKVIYDYPLRQAQQDEYFKPIRFEPVFEVDPEEGDRAIAAAALRRLHEDREAGRNHIVMARCGTIDRAEEIHRLYNELSDDCEPLLVHSRHAEARETVRKLRRGKSQVVVCVDMLGEGFDLPELKIAALHDTHKSLAVLLQFTGRFTRSAGSDVGEATVIANIANQDVKEALERLYSEDADWNHLLSEYSFEAVKEHSELVEFLNSSKRLDESDETESIEISQSLLRPTFNAAVFRCESFRPMNFYKGLSSATAVHRVWLHEDSNTLYFVTRTEPSVRWSRSQRIRDRAWGLFILHYDEQQKLLYLHSSDKKSLHEGIARAVGGDDIQLIRGDTVFRTLGHINRLVFQNVGVRKHGRRNLRYAMYTGADVAQALTTSQRTGSVKNNVSGTGYENGQPVAVGCSYKGRVWSREQGPIPRLVRWCKAAGAKLLDDSIDTEQIIANVLIPEEIETLPNETVLSIDWPDELLRQADERVMLKWPDGELPLTMFGIEYDGMEPAANRIVFSVTSQEIEAKLGLELVGSEGFRVRQMSGTVPTIQVGRIETPLDEYLTEYPPLIRFTNLSELDGNLLVSPKGPPNLSLPPERFEPWDWSDTDIRTESMWKDGRLRASSIQGKAADHYIEGGFDVVFDDDASGEAADLICLKEEEEDIRLGLVHCKFTKGETAGERVSDVQEVCSQAVRSAKWIWQFRALCRHITDREKRLRKPHRSSRFLAGDGRELNRLLKMSRFKGIRGEIVIVQPGLSQKGCTGEQAAVLAAAHGFLQETVAVNLDIVCSE